MRIVIGALIAAGCFILTPGTAVALETTNGYLYVYQGTIRPLDEDCSGADGGSRFTDTFKPDGKSVKRTASGTSTDNHDTDATDTSTITNRITGSVRSAPTAAGERVRLRVGGASTSTAALGSETKCRVLAEAGVTLDYSITLAKDHWVTVRVPSLAGVTGSINMFDRPGTTGFRSIAFGAGSADVLARFVIPAGTWQTRVETDYRQSLPATADGLRVELGADVTVDYDPVGVGTGPAKGRAKNHVSLGRSRNCTTSSLRGRVSPAVAKAVLKVNGRPNVVLDKPVESGDFRLTDLPPAREARVKAVLTLADGRVLKATRTYLPCSGPDLRTARKGMEG